MNSYTHTHTHTHTHTQGKLELEMEVVSADEEQLRPAGKARDEPNMNPVLDPPK